MKYIIVPATVSICDRSGKQVLAVKHAGAKPELWSVSHEDFVFDFLLSHPSLSKGGGDGLRRQRKVMQLFEGCTEGLIIGVEDADYRILRQIVDALEWSGPHAFYAPYAQQLLPHVEAWEAAAKQDDAWKKKRDNGSNATLVTKDS